MSFPMESNLRVNKTFKLICGGMCDPIKSSALGKNNYFLLFIDDFSRDT